MSSINRINEIQVKETNKPNNNYNSIENKDFIIKSKDNNYYLIIEIQEQIIYFTLININESLKYYYKNNRNLLNMIGIFELNQTKYSTSESILNVFDKIYEYNKLLIEEDINDNNSCKLIIKFYNIYNASEIEYKIKLKKEEMSENDKISMLFRLLKQKINKNILNNNNENKILKKQIKIMNNEIKKREGVIHSIFKKQEYLIKKLYNKIISLENFIYISGFDPNIEMDTLIKKIGEKYNKKMKILLILIL